MVRTDDGVKISLRLHRQGERRSALIICPGFFQILFVHGTKDVIIGVEHSRRLHQAAREPKRLEIIEGGGHAEALFRDEPERFTRLMQEWFGQTLAAYLGG